MTVASTIEAPEGMKYMVEATSEKADQQDVYATYRLVNLEAK
jgi:hypothetical protein